MPRFNLKWMKNSFTYQATKIWNSLESDVRKENLSKLAMLIKSKSTLFIRMSFCLFHSYLSNFLSL